MKFYRAITVGSLVPCLTVACISGEDVRAPGTSSSAGGKSSADGQGGAIAGNSGGTKSIASVTGGKSNAGVGGSKVVGSTVAETGGTQAVSVGGQSSTSPSTGAGGIAATGGMPSTAAAPTGLGVSLPQSGAITGSQSLTIHVDIVNTSSTTQELSAVTMRYWYVDDGWGSAQLTMANEYVSIGYSNTGTVTYLGSSVVSPAQTGADHYLEFSFTGKLAATNDATSNDKFHVQVALHAPGYAGSANVANDYSAMSTTGYDDRITLYSAGTLIWGTEPGGSTVTGSGGASGVGGTGAQGGATSQNSATSGGAVSIGGDSSAGGVVTTGGVLSAGGDSSSGGVLSAGGDSSSGGVLSAGGDDSGIGGDAGTDSDASTGGDMSIGGNSSTGNT